MTKTKHTPAPWSTTASLTPDNTGGFDHAILDADSNIIAEAFEHVDYAEATKNGYLKMPVKANANLIAAAPEMLEALQCSLALGMPTDEGISVLSKAGWSHEDRFDLSATTFVNQLTEKAIAKAKGETS